MQQPRLSLGLILIAVSLLFCLTSMAAATETILYSEGFESNSGGFAVGAGSTAGWEWGTPCSASCVGPQAAHDGANCWGTNLLGPIPRPCEGSIVSPAIALPTLAGDQIIRVRFWAYVDVDGMYDRGEFFVSSNGLDWQSLMRMYATMGTSGAALPAWRKYEFTLDPSYAAGNLYLRYRAAVYEPPPTFFCGGSGSLSGIYIDDIAVTLLDTSGPKKLFTMEAWEDDSAWASCPWVAPWNGSAFSIDNDVYSVARGAQNEYTDYYRLMKPLVAKDGVYPVALRELEQEDSHTDFAALLLVDHEPGVAVAPDDEGNLVAYRPASLLPPQSAMTAGGEDVLTAVSVADGSGYAAYSGDVVIADFGVLDAPGGTSLILGVTGFVFGTGEERPYAGPPAVVVETQDAAGQWLERGRLRPRFAYSTAAFDLSSYFDHMTPVRVRLRSISHSTKYHLIDYVALQAGSGPAFTLAQVSPISATVGSNDVREKIVAADADYVQMGSGQEMLLAFPAPPLASDLVREFVFVTKGYYIPKGDSYLVYTWDGSDWILRDGFTYAGTDQFHSFDLSLFLPDPNGEYRVRVWQDYQWEPAGIDYVQMSSGASAVPLSTAWDYRYGMDIKPEVFASDDQRIEWSGCPRDRVTEFFFDPPPVSNFPPGTCPVTATDSSQPQICWTYFDRDGEAQVSAEVQIWTGPNQTGTNVWNPAVFNGTASCVTYSGQSLAPGTYYACVRAFDGRDWGGWCWGSFTVSGCFPGVSLALPTQWSLAWQPGGGGTVRWYLGGGGEFDVAGVDPASLRLNGTVPAIQTVILPQMEGFVGPVLVANFPRWEAMKSCVQLPGPQDVTLTGGFLGDPSLCLAAMSSTELVAAEGETNGTPEEAAGISTFGIRAVRPNPTASGTEIEFGMPAAGLASFGIFDSGGRLVRTLSEGSYTPGYHKMFWNGRNNDGQPVSAGVYFVRGRYADKQVEKRIVVVQ